MQKMKHLLKRLKPIAYLFALLVLLQSCVAYKIKPFSVEKVSSYSDRRIKIITNDGDKYKLRWIEEKDGTVVSIKNTKRVFVDKSKITQIIPDGVTLEYISKNNVAVQIKTKRRNYDFIKIEVQEDQIKGFTRVSMKDTTTVVIPIDQIEKIKLQAKGISSAINAVSVAVLTAGAVFGLAYLSWRVGED